MKYYIALYLTDVITPTCLQSNFLSIKQKFFVLRLVPFFLSDIRKSDIFNSKLDEKTFHLADGCVSLLMPAWQVELGGGGGEET